MFANVSNFPEHRCKKVFVHAWLFSFQVRTYTAPRSSQRAAVSPPPATAATAAAACDSDTDGYDVALEHLLTASEKSDASLTPNYAQHGGGRPRLFGIKNSVPVT